MYYPRSENKGADQLRSYCEADLRLCFRLCRLLVFPCGGSNDVQDDRYTFLGGDLDLIKCGLGGKFFCQFYSRTPLKLLNVIEGGETRHKWKLARNAASFTLIINFPAKTEKGQGQGNQPPLKKRASGVLVSQHKDKKKASSDVRLADQP